jgi:hypothetical protein
VAHFFYANSRQVHDFSYSKDHRALCVRDRSEPPRSIVPSNAIQTKLQTEPLNKQILTDALKSFPFDGTPECSIAEAERMMDFLGAKNRYSRDKATVSGALGADEEVTIWINSFEVKGQYGLRFGTPDGKYWGNNDSLIHITKNGIR